MTRTVDVIHLGPQKSGTTWLYECLKEHPGVACAPRDSIHYYDMFYFKGESWYLEHFADARPGQLLFDTTPSYLRSLRAPARMYRDNPDAKLAVTLRHPVDRAFSHFWHEQKDPRREYDFTEVFTNYDFFSSWLEPGFYAEHLERYLEHFSEEQILFQRFELLNEDPRAFLREFLEFLAIDADFVPSWIDTKVNAAKVIRTPVGRLRVKADRGLTRVLGREFQGTQASRWLTQSRRYARGIEADTYNQLLEACLDEIDQTEKLTGLDLSRWKSFRETEVGL